MKKLLTILLILPSLAFAGNYNVPSKEGGMVVNMPLDKGSSTTGADIPRTWVAAAGSPGIAGDVITFGAGTETVRNLSYWVIGNTYAVSATLSGYAGSGSIILPYDSTVGAYLPAVTADGVYTYLYTPTTDFVSMYSYDTNSGIVTVNYIKDVTGTVIDHQSCYNGTRNGTTWTSDRNGNSESALSFDGVDDYVDLSSTDFITDHASDTVGSISVWVKYSNTYNSVFALSKGDTSNYFRVSDGNSKLTFMVFASGSIISLISDDSCNDNTWHHMVVTQDGTTCKMYIDGDAQSLTAGSGWIDDLSDIAYAYIGDFEYGDGGVRNWDGSIQELRYYNRALSQAEVTSLYNTKTQKLTVSP